MNIKQVARLLNDVGVKTLATDDFLKPDVDYGVNYYQLMINKDNNKWEFLYVPREKRSSGGEEIIKTFDDEASASKYYYLTELHSYYRNYYVYPFQLGNKEINIGESNFTLKNLNEAFWRLNISKKYYSFDEKIKEYSMFLEKINKDESKVHFLGRGGKKVNSSLVLENWLAYYSMYRLVYTLYLFDKHYADLIKNKEIAHIFTDEDYKTLLTGVVLESAQ